MGNRHAVHGQIAMAATDAEPRIHVEHAAGGYSLALTPEDTDVSVYVRGTASELLELAARIVAAVPATECHPLAGMHADPHTCGLRARDDDPCPIDGGTDHAFGDHARPRGADDDNDERRLGVHTCPGCDQVLIHDVARYWFCANTECPHVKRTVLIHHNGDRAYVGTMA